MSKKLKLGDSYQCSFSFTQEQVTEFAKLSGDNNPLHLDSEYAANTIFKKPIIHGFLTGSIFSKVIGTEFPGYGSIYLSQTLNFKSPAFVDTEYLASFKIIEIKESKHIGVIDCSINAKDGKPVLLGEAVVMNKENF